MEKSKEIEQSGGGMWLCRYENLEEKSNNECVLHKTCEKKVWNDKWECIYSSSSMIMEWVMICIITYRNDLLLITVGNDLYNIFVLKHRSLLSLILILVRQLNKSIYTYPYLYVWWRIM